MASFLKILWNHRRAGTSGLQRVAGPVHALISSASICVHLRILNGWFSLFVAILLNGQAIESIEKSFGTGFNNIS